MHRGFVVVSAAPILLAIALGGCSSGNLPAPPAGGGGGGGQPPGNWQPPDATGAAPLSAARLFAATLGPFDPNTMPAPRAVADALVFVVRQGQASNIAIMPPDGSFTTLLTNDGCLNSWPVLSPDGRWIAWTVRRAGNPLKMMIMRVDGTGARRVTTDPDEIWETSPSWAPDSRRLAYVHAVPAGAHDFNLTLAVVDAGVDAAQGQAGHPVDVPLQGFSVINAPAWVNNNRLIFAASTAEDPADRLYAVNTDGSDLVKLTEAYEDVPAEDQSDSLPAVSPDGQQVYFTRQFMNGNDTITRIMVMNIDGSDVRTFAAAGDASFTRPWVSPDGSRLVCTRTTPVGPEIWVAPIPNGQPHKVADGTLPCWSRVTAIPRKDVPHRDECTSAPNTVPATTIPTGRVLWRSNHRGGNAWDIETINANGTGFSRWPDDPCMILAARWMPDGQHVAFLSCRPGASIDLYVADADGSNARRLTEGAIPHTTWAPSLAVSPDGGKICYTRSHGDEMWLHVVNADGTGDHAITHGPYDVMPDYSPDGSRIVYAHMDSTDASNDVSYLMTANADGTGARDIVHRLDGCDAYPRWHPSGNFIVFVRWAYDGNAGPFADLWVTTPDSRVQVQLTAAHMFIRAPVFNGDGTKLLYELCDLSGYEQIFIHDLVTDDAHPLHGAGYHQMHPDWWDGGAQGAGIVGVEQLRLLHPPVG